MSHTEKPSTVTKAGVSGLSFGACLAMVISYTAYKSVLWAMLGGKS